MVDKRIELNCFVPAKTYHRIALLSEKTNTSKGEIVDYLMKTRELKSWQVRPLKCQECGNEFVGTEDAECHICGGESRRL